MNQSDLQRLQSEAYTLLTAQEADSENATRREELLADAREQRLLTIINEAVYFGTIKAHLTLAVLGGLAWAALTQVF